ncbi:hypothetical protein EWM64_g1648, partial [Hericium alpestre]
PFMPFSVARLRLLLAPLFISLASAHENILFTSSVSYCSPPETLLVQQFDIAYFPVNNSIVFNVSVASVEQNVNVSANIFLNVYGSHPFNITLDICTLLNGALCPLPVYNFIGAETLPLPPSINVASHIPGIAYQIPDLEAFAQLTLADAKTGELKACIQSTLSNGWSTHQPGVAWATGGIGFLALASAVWHSFTPGTIAPLRLLDLFALYQAIASSSFLNLNYPVIFRAYTLNFSWAMGLFAQSPTSSMQRSINHMRNITGGALPNGSGSSIALINRRLSPYNSPPSRRALVPDTFRSALSAFPAVDIAKLIGPSNSSPVTELSVGNATRLSSDTSGNVQTVSQDASNVLQAGIPIYVNTIGIATANAFMTVFFTGLILLACSLAALGILYGVFFLVQRSGKSSDWVKQSMSRYPTFARTWGIRIVFICFYPLLVFVFYQWTLHDSWLSDLISAITFVALSGLVGFAALRVALYAHKSSPYNLFIDLPSFEPLYGKYRVERYYFYLLPLAAIVLRSLFTAFSHANGTVAIIAIIIIEGLLAISIMVFRPTPTRRGDVFSSTIAIMRLVCAGLCVAFIEHLQTAAIPRVAIGIIIAVIYSIAVILMFLNILWNLGLREMYLRLRYSKASSSQTPSSKTSMVEKVDTERGLVEDDKKAFAEGGRPSNPTPTNNVPLDPHVNQPYPAFTPTTTFAEPPSASDTETSYGSPAQSRWRASFLQTPEPQTSRFRASPSPRS